jgi:DDE superfamily endonuclease
MEEVLEVYTRPSDPSYPQVCMEEKSLQLLATRRGPLSPQPRQVAKQDYEYQRKGTANVFMCFEPLAGRRSVKVTPQRTKRDGAECIRDLAEPQYPKAEKIVSVMDNLKTHSLASLSEIFAPAEAWRLAQRFAVPYTPKQGSWLNMAESELSVLSRQCLQRRIADRVTLKREVQAWGKGRNAKQVIADGRFTTAEARIKLKRLYPSFQE